MGLFDLFKKTIVPEKQNWGATLYYNTQEVVGGYFGDRGSFTIEKTDAGTFEAMFLHAAMMNIMIKRGFPEKCYQYWDEYMNEFAKEMLYKKQDFKKITGIEMSGEFIQRRIEYYLKRWIALISREEEQLPDVTWMIYHEPLSLLPEETIGSTSYAISFFKVMDLSHYMIWTYKNISDNIEDWKRKYR